MTSGSTTPDSMSPVPPSEEKSAGKFSSSPSGGSTSSQVPVRRWPPDVDPQTGHLRRISEEEWQARYEELTRRLAEIDAEDDTPEEVYDEFMRNLDEERRRQGRPPAFEGYY
jgi:hypothetical protein